MCDREKEKEREIEGEKREKRRETMKLYIHSVYSFSVSIRFAMIVARKNPIAG